MSPLHYAERAVQLNSKRAAHVKLPPLEGDLMARNTALPTLTPEQRSAALKKGSANRKARADWLDRIRTKDATVVDFLDAAEEDEVLARARVSAMLRAVPGIGEARAQELMVTFGIAGSRRVSGLGKNQKEHLRQHFAN